MDKNVQGSTYISIMGISLKRKSNILDQLLKLTQEQETVISMQDIDSERFNHIIDEKDKLIRELLSLDRGFDSIYQRVRDELLTNKNQYKGEIDILKVLITAVTDKSVNLQAAEQRNKEKLDLYLKTKRKDIKEFKISNRTVSSYYKNMADQHQGQAYFFDKKN